MPQQVPPPYANITGVARAVMKYNAQESFADYDGNARPGELVVNTSDYSLYIGNADGLLNAVAGGGNGAPGGSNSQIQYNNNGAFGGEANMLYNDSTGTASFLKLSSLTSANLDIVSAANRNINITPASNTDVFITAAGASGKVQIQGGNNILSLQQGVPEFDVQADDINFAINSNTNGFVYFDLTQGGNSDFVIGTPSATWVFSRDGTLASSGGNGKIRINGNANIIGSDSIIASNLYIDSTSGNWIFDQSGNLTLPTAGSIQGDGSSPGPGLLGFDLITTSNANIGQTLRVTGNANLNILNVTANTNLQGGINISGNIIANVTVNTGVNPWSISQSGGNAAVIVDDNSIAITGNVTLPANIVVNLGANPQANTTATVTNRLPITINGNTYYIMLTS